MTVVVIAQYEIEEGTPYFQWNVQTVSGKERQVTRSKDNRPQNTEFIRVKSLGLQDREDRTSITRTNKNDPDYQIRSPFCTSASNCPLVVQATTRDIGGRNYPRKLVYMEY